MKNKLSRILALFLVLLTLLSVCSCGMSDTLEGFESLAEVLDNYLATMKIPETDSPSSDVAQVTTEPTTDSSHDTVTYAPETTQAPHTSEAIVIPEPPEYDENGFIKDDIPEGLDYRGEEICLLVWQEYESPEWYVDDSMLDGDIVNQAIYDRNNRVSDNLGVEIFFIEAPGNLSNKTFWISLVENSVSVNARDFDIIAGYSISMAACTTRGLFFDMLDPSCEYLNFAKPWWGNNLLDQATFGGKLYYASGDISRSTIEQMYLCYANSDLLSMYNRDNPQELAVQDEWTYEAFFELCRDVYIDENGNGKKDCDKTYGDTFGYITSGIHVDPWLYSSGALMCEVGDDGKLMLSPSIKSEKVVNTINFLNEFFQTPAGIYTSDAIHQQVFGQGRAMFIIDYAKIARDLHKNYSNTEFVILPCPKYDVNQAEYETALGIPFTLYSIAADIADPTMASAFLECYASDGYRNISPAIFEYITLERYGTSRRPTMIFDILRENIVYDPGRIFSSELIGQQAFRDTIKNGTDWSIIITHLEKGLKQKIADLNASLVP